MCIRDSHYTRLVISFKVVRWGGCGVGNFEETGGVNDRLMNERGDRGPFESGPGHNQFSHVASTKWITFLGNELELVNIIVKISGHVNPSTNRNEFCALAFMSYETAENLRVAFRFFKTICLQPPSVIISFDSQ